MSQIIKTNHLGYSATNTSQTLAINEGDLTAAIAPIVLTTNRNYGDYLFAVFPITGTSQSAAISLVCSTLNGLSFTRSGDTYVLSSVYTKNGVKVNNWQYFKIALQSLSLAFSNSDISQSFTIPWAMYYGQSENWFDNSLGFTGNITVNVNAVPDATGLTQTLNVLQAFGGGGTPNNLAGYSGANIQINDPNQALKTYRVTYTITDVTNGTGTSDMKMSLINAAASINYSWVKTFTLTGTQAYINGIMTNSGGDGFYIFQRNPNFVGTQTIQYVQEVLTTTEPGAVVPYVQETGTLSFVHQAVNSFTQATGITYAEDVDTTPFSIGTVTDQSGQSWISDTGTNGLNWYNFLIEATGTYPGTNPIKLSCTGFGGTPTSSFNIQGSYQYYQDSGSPNNNFIVIPPADWTDPIPLRIRLYRGNGTGTNVISDTTLTLNCSATHSEFDIIGGFSYVLGSNVIDFGEITDQAVGKSYTVTIDLKDHPSSTHGTLSSPTYGSWNATGGAYGYGRLTISGTKAQVNADLAAITYTTAGGQVLNDTVILEYTQTQTTNSIVQGTKTLSAANDIVWNSGSFTYDQDVTTTWDLATLGGNISTGTHTCYLYFSVPLSTANLGSVTGWTNYNDYIWSITDTRANINAALSAVVFNPPAQLTSSFTLDIKVYDGATLLADTSAIGSTRTVTLGTPVSAAWTSSALTYNQDTATTFTNLLTLNSNFNSSSTYTLRLKTSVATGGSIAGWTTIDSTTFEKTDTKANLQSSLNSLVFTPGLTFVSNFTFNVEAYRSGLKIYDSATASNSKTVSIGVLYQFFPTGSSLGFDQDNTVTWAPFGSFSSNFDASKTYTIEMVSSVANVGSFTGWTTVNTTTFSKTGTGSALTTAMNSLQFVPSITGQSSFTLTTKINRSSTLLSTSTAKSITIGQIYALSVTGTALSYDQNYSNTYSGIYTLSSNFNNSNTYTATITFGGSGINPGITGWTPNGSYTSFSKTDTGVNLIAALASIVLVTGIGNYATSYNMTLNITRSSTSVASISKTLSLGNHYDINFNSTSFTYNYGETTVFNIGSLNSWFSTATTNAAYSKILGLPGWTLAFDTKANNDAALAAYSFDPGSYVTTGQTYAIRADLANSSGSGPVGLTGMLNKNVTFTPINLPTINFNGSTTVPYIIGANTNLPISLTNIPNDGSTYKIWVEVSSNQIIGSGGGNVNSPLGSWTYYTDGTNNGQITTSFLTRDQLADAIAGLRLFTRADSTLQSDSSPPSIRYQIYPNAAVSLPWRTSGFVNFFNAAKINLNATSFYTPKLFTTSINVGSYTWPGSVTYLDSGTTYTLKVDTRTSLITIPSWTNEGSNIYSISGTPSALNTALSSLAIQVSSGAPTFADSFFKLYQASTYLSTQTVRLNT